MGTHQVTAPIRQSSSLSVSADSGEFLLYTKLWIPNHIQQYVQRPELVARLNESLQGKCALVCAPAGFGKTSLVIDWLQQLQRPAAWFSLDSADNEPKRFLRYLVAALQSIFPEVGETLLVHLNAPQLPTLQKLFTLLLHDIQKVDEAFVLVLDDCHLLTHAALQECLGFLMEHMPPQMHLTLTSRHMPLFPLGRLRARRELVELSTNDLRFSAERSCTLFSNLQLDLNPHQAKLLCQQTEGWVAGLHLAGLSLQQSNNPDQLLESFSGSHRFIADFLSEEVLQRQSPQLQQFLLKTSILQRFNADLCNAMLGIDKSESLLEELERSQLFIIRLDHRQNWYRYHHLFRDLLLSQLKKRTTPEVQEELHRSASQWLVSHRWIDEGLQHLQVIEDYDKAAKMLLSLADSCFQQRYLEEFVVWLKRLPTQVLHRHPKLMMYELLDKFDQGDNTGLKRNLPPTIQALKNKLTQLEEKSPERQDYEGYIKLCQAYIARNQGDQESVIRQTKEAMAKLSDKQHSFAYHMIISQVVAQLKRHISVGKALTKLDELYAQCVYQQNLYFMQMVTWVSAYMSLRRGRLLRSETINLRLLQDVKQIPSYKPGHSVELGIHQGLAEVYWEQYRLEEAEQRAERSLKIAQKHKHFRSMVKALISLANILNSQGRQEEAFRLIDKTKAMVAPHTILPGQIHRSLLSIQRIILQHGATTQVEEWFKQKDIGLETPVNHTTEPLFILKIRLYLKQSKLEEANKLLHYLLDEMADKEMIGPLAEAHLLQAIVFQRQKKEEQAQEEFGLALQLAQPENNLRIFVEEREATRSLLQHCIVQHTETKAFAHKILALLPKKKTTPKAAAPTPQSIPPIASEPNIHTPSCVIYEEDPYFLDPLSKRETEIIQLANTGLTNKELAQKLYLAHTTIKKHMSNIYSKLGVKNRTKALVRAKELGLIH